MSAFEERKLSLKLNAYGKINLGLDVVRKRDDGYHEVKMIMQTVDICDYLEFKKCDKPGIFIGTNLSYLPGDENNLIYKAAKLLMDEFKIESGVEISLEKNIPIAAGMAGGSTDAAAAFKGINELFELGLSETELMERGVKIGADVPYCIMGGTALSEGIGEILTALPSMVQCPLIVAKPDINVSTKYVYENLHANELKHHPDIDGMVEAIRNGDLKGIADRMENVLENVTVAEYPIINEIKEFLKGHGAVNALMSGSGPTVFALFDSQDKARAAFERLKEAGLARQVFLTGMKNNKV